jgi:hypothetical protein
MHNGHKSNSNFLRYRCSELRQVDAGGRVGGDTATGGAAATAAGGLLGVLAAAAPAEQLMRTTSHRWGPRGQIQPRVYAMRQTVVTENTEKEGGIGPGSKR